MNLRDQVRSDWPSRPAWTIFSSREEFGGDRPLLSLSSAMGIRERLDGEGRAASHDTSGYRVVKVGDLVINRLVAREGAIAVSGLEGIISPAYWVFRPHPYADSRYLNYLLHSSPYLAEIARRSKFMPPAQFDLPWEQFRTLPVVCPDLSVQRAIADYLDAETARIDALIAKRQQMRHLLEERLRVAIVLEMQGPRGNAQSQTGTASGTQGRTWEMARLKEVVDLDNGYPFEAERFSSEVGMPLVRVRDLLPGTTTTYYDGSFPSSAVIHDGDLLVGMDGDFNSVVWQGGQALLNQRVCRLRAKPGLDAGFLSFAIDLPLKRLNERALSTTVKHLSSIELLGERIPLPPISEQPAIARRLQVARLAVTTTLDRLERQVALLRERKQALITAAVTGDKDVPGTAA